MSNSLLVPLTLDVLLANNALVARDNFRSWKYAYVHLGDDTFHSPEPMGFDDNYSNMTAGAYLHWVLPRSLRTGKQGSSSAYPLVPNRWLIIRISRDADGKNVQKSWVLESDCPNSSDTGSSFYMVSDAVVEGWKSSPEPNRHSAQPVPISTATNTGAFTVNLGRAFDPATWKEHAAGNLFLTAVAPGNLEFSAYVPHNNGLFSFYDDLSDAPATSILSYLVIGWYSDPSADILTTGTGGFTGGSTIEEVLTYLNWTVADNGNPDAVTASLYSGMALGLNWELHAETAPAPDQLEDIRATKNMTVAVANTGVDAFSTLVGAQLATIANYTDTTKFIELLRAFHYDLLPVLNQINGDALLDQKIRQEWFSSKYGGTRWKIVADQPADGTPYVSAATITPAEQAWLLQLNLDQQELDAAMQVLYSLQWELNAVWWKSGYMNATAQQMSPNQTGIEAGDLAASLDPADANSILTSVLNQLVTVNGLLAKVPQPVSGEGVNPQNAYLKGVAAFASQKGIGAGKSLKAVAQPRFWKPNNPNILISGVEPSAASDPDSSLVVRLPSQQVTSLTACGHSFTPSSLGSILPPLVNPCAGPGGVNAIYQEFFLLDPSNAPQMAAQAGIDQKTLSGIMTSHDPSSYDSAVMPACGLEAWTQRWNPLYLEWQVIHTPVPFEWIADPTTGKRTRNWSFNGTDYEMAASPAGVGGTETISGRSLLSPHTQFTFGDRLAAFVKQYGGTETDLKNLYSEIESTDDWKFLSQELVDFGEWLTQRDARAFRRPTAETFSKDGTNVPFAKVIGYPDAASLPPYDTPSYGQGLVNSVPAVKIAGPSDFPFHAIRGGQFYLSHVIVYDKYGRTLHLIDPAGGGLHDANNFPLVRDAALAVTNNLTPGVAAPFQLPPRLLQFARLNLLLVDQQDDAKVLGLAADVNPVCGWVIPNHLDQSLLVFGPDGTNLGEIKMVQGIQRDPLSRWSAPAHNSIEIADIAALSPQLGAFVTGAQGKTATEFSTLLGVIDTTLWTTDPVGDRTDQNLSVLIGRPLALLRVQLQFSLDGPAITSCDWPTPVGAAATNPNIPDFTSSCFSIRFGDLATREDGVIGYFENGDYNLFYSVAAPQTTQGYVSEIGPLAGQDGNYINLPFDGKTTATITLLADPRAAIHATTGILPVKELTIPAQFVDGPLASMEITFRMGPLLSRINDASTTAGAAAFPSNLTYLPIIEKNGTWSWWEEEVNWAGTQSPKTSWQGYGVENASTQADLSNDPATLREGYLQFAINLKKVD